jgi:predicted nucleic acid-binding protein
LQDVLPVLAQLPMPQLLVVADSGPLIALALIEHLHLLRDIYGAEWVPNAVWREVTETAPERPGAIEMVRMRIRR